MLFNFLVCLLLAASIQISYCNDHVYGTPNSGKNLNRNFCCCTHTNKSDSMQIEMKRKWFYWILGDKLLFEKVLFSKNLKQPKNYTLIFKYIGSEISSNITHAKFDVFNTVSTTIFNLFHQPKWCNFTFTDQLIIDQRGSDWGKCGKGQRENFDSKHKHHQWHKRSCCGSDIWIEC